jgi:magnesium transporter
MDYSYEKELLELIAGETDEEALKAALANYHLYDVAQALLEVTEEERIRVYQALGEVETAELFGFYEDKDELISELDEEHAAKILDEMEAPDVVEILSEIEEEDRDRITSLMDDEARELVERIEAYDEEAVGSYMTDDLITLTEGQTVPSATGQMIKQAGEKDNILTLFVTDKDGVYMGAVELQKLIRARRDDSFDDLIMRSYPFVYDDEIMGDCVDRLKEYAEDIIPVLNRSGVLVGALTADTISEVAEDEIREDYAKLGGLTADEETEESVISAVKNRLPWLILLLFLGLAVSSVVGLFEGVIASLPVLVFFQTMILGMAGNAGTQSLAVAVMRLSSGKEKQGGLRELPVGLINGLIMGVVAFGVVFLYLALWGKEVIEGAGFSMSHAALTGGAVGISLAVSIAIAAFVGSALPRLLTRIGVDPAVASGPFITTLNDVVAVAVYYGLCFGIFGNYII